MSATMPELEIVPATESDIGDVISLLDGAARWLLEHGIDQWHPGQWRRERIAEAVESGSTYLVGRDGVTVATVTLEWSDEFFWGPGPTSDAGYVHRLAVARDAHGLGIGRALIEWAEQQAGAKGRRLLRLDCACENPRLRRYYEGVGFEPRGEKTISGRWGTYCAALYEKAVAAREGPFR